MRDELFQYLDILENELNPEDKLHLLALISLYHSSYTVLIDDKEYIDRLLQLTTKILNANDVDFCNSNQCNNRANAKKDITFFTPYHSKNVLYKVKNREV